MNVLIGLLRGYGIADKVAKSRTMTCQPGALRSGVSEESKGIKCAGGGSFLPSPILFNIVVENVIRTWLAMTMEDLRVPLILW